MEIKNSLRREDEEEQVLRLSYVLTGEIKRHRTLTGGYSFSITPFAYLQNEDEPAGKVRLKCQRSDYANMKQVTPQIYATKIRPFSDSTSAALLADKVIY